MKYDIQKRTKKIVDETIKDWNKISDFQFKGEKTAFAHALREDDEYRGEQAVFCANIGGVPINIRYRELIIRNSNLVLLQIH